MSILGQKQWIILLYKKCFQKVYPEVSGPFFLDELVCKVNFVNIFKNVAAAVLSFKRTFQDGLLRRKLPVFKKNCRNVVLPFKKKQKKTQKKSQDATTSH